MNCDKIRQSLADYAVDNLRGTSAQEIREHLLTCADCAAELRALNAAVGLVEDVGLREPPVGLWNGLYNRITERSQAQESKLPWFRLGLRLRIAAAVAAAAVVLVAALLSQVKAPSPASFANAAAAEYLEGHAMSSRNTLFADRFSLASVAALAEEEQRTNE